MDCSATPPRIDVAKVETWIFDLDNTLYPAASNLFAQVDVKMREFISTFLGLDQDEAYRIQKAYFAEFGTTLRGLMTHHNLEPQGYLDYVHDIDVTPVPPNPKLADLLDQLPGRKIIFTNASKSHVTRVTERLGIAGHFEGVFDIVDANYLPKPTPAIYDDLLERFSIDPTKAVMVEDIAKNLEPAAARGMTTVWLRTDTRWGREGGESDYVHHRIDDLDHWLVDLIEKSKP